MYLAGKSSTIFGMQISTTPLSVAVHAPPSPPWFQTKSPSLNDTRGGFSAKRDSPDGPSTQSPCVGEAGFAGFPNSNSPKTVAGRPRKSGGSRFGQTSIFFGIQTYRSIIQKALESDPKSLPLNVYLAEIEFGIGNMKAAKLAAENALELASKPQLRLRLSGQLAKFVSIAERIRNDSDF